MRDDEGGHGANAVTDRDLIIATAATTALYPLTTNTTR